MRRIHASRIGMTIGPTPDGPWEVADDPCSIREDSWDNWHLSTGPIVALPGRDPVMFYNGATLDARWRIGWITFDANFERVTGRGIEPLIVPPPPEHRAATDIAFAASCLVDDDAIQLYFSARTAYCAGRPCWCWKAAERAPPTDRKPFRNCAN